MAAWTEQNEDSMSDGENGEDKVGEAGGCQTRNALDVLRELGAQ